MLPTGNAGANRNVRGNSGSSSTSSTRTSAAANGRRFHRFRRHGRIAIHVIHQPIIQPQLHIVSGTERTDFVAYDAFQILQSGTWQKLRRNREESLALAVASGSSYFARACMVQEPIRRRNQNVCDTPKAEPGV